MEDEARERRIVDAAFICSEVYEGIKKRVKTKPRR